MKCPRCGAPLVADPLESFCELETCPEVGAAMVMCSRHYLLGGDWQTGCAFEGCPAILPRLAAERARLLAVLRDRPNPCRCGCGSWSCRGCGRWLAQGPGIHDHTPGLVLVLGHGRRCAR